MLGLKTADDGDMEWSRICEALDVTLYPHYGDWRVPNVLLIGWDTYSRLCGCISGDFWGADDWGW